MKEICVGIIAEGKTDVDYLNEIICKVLEKNQNCLFLQPDAGFSNTGWAGVWQFCIDNLAKDSIDRFMNEYSPALDALVISLDGDLSREGTIYCIENVTECDMANGQNSLACYYSRKLATEFEKCTLPTEQKLPHLPISDRDVFLRKTIDSWCGFDEGESRADIIYAIPFDALEAWIISSFGISTIKGINIEEFKDPFNRFIWELKEFNGFKPYLGKDAFCRAFIEHSRDNWDTTRAICSQAENLNNELITLKERLSDT